MSVSSLGYYRGKRIACKGFSYDPLCFVIIIANNIPQVESYLHHKKFYISFVELGIIPDDRSISLNMLGFRIYSYILRNFIRFNDTLFQQAESMIRMYNKRDLIGLHVRMSDSSSDFKESEQFLYSSDITRFYNCKCIPFTSKTVFYVASDSIVVKKRIEAETNFTAVYNNILSSHSEREIMRGKTGGGVCNVLLDVLVLSKCSMLIGTLGSSLTYLAGALHGNVPFYVTRNHDCFFPTRLTTIHPKAMIQSNITYKFPSIPCSRSVF